VKKDIAEKWVKALRSGEYEQGRGQLRINNKHCCLGVLCDISKLSIWDQDSYIKGSSAITLPTEVKMWADMKSGGGHLGEDKLSLWQLNDAGKTFSEIANIIEAEWETL